MAPRPHQWRSVRQCRTVSGLFAHRRASSRWGGALARSSLGRPRASCLRHGFGPKNAPATAVALHRAGVAWIKGRRAVADARRDPRRGGGALGECRSRWARSAIAQLRAAALPATDAVVARGVRNPAALDRPSRRLQDGRGVVVGGMNPTMFAALVERWAAEREAFEGGGDRVGSPRGRAVRRVGVGGYAEWRLRGGALPC